MIRRIPHSAALLSLLEKDKAIGQEEIISGRPYPANDKDPTGIFWGIIRSRYEPVKEATNAVNAVMN